MSSTSELTNLTPEQESQIRSGYEEALRYSISYFREAIVPIALFAPLTTLYITFILFSTSFQRQSCGFWCLMLAFGLCVVQIGAYLRFSVLAYYQQDGNLALRLASYLHICIPWYLEVALTCKVFHLYSSTALYVPTCFLVIRSGLFCAIIACTQNGFVNASNGMLLCQYILQLCTTTYCSSMLILKAIEVYRSQVSRIENPKDQMYNRLRMLIETVFMTYSLAVPVNLVMVIVWCLVIRYDTQTVNEVMKYTILLNTYGSLLWALLATQWSTIRDLRSESFIQHVHSKRGTVQPQEDCLPYIHSSIQSPQLQRWQGDDPDTITEQDAIPSVSLSDALAIQSPPRTIARKMWLGRSAIGTESSTLHWLTKPREIQIANQHEEMTKEDQ